MDINSLVAYTIVATFFAGAFSYVVLKPLNKSIEDLQLIMKGLREELKKSEERRHALEVKVAEIDQSTRSAHHRLDDHIKEGVG